MNKFTEILKKRFVYLDLVLCISYLLYTDTQGNISFLFCHIPSTVNSIEKSRIFELAVLF